MAGPLFALILLGCTDAGDGCTRLEAPVQTYETRAECEKRQEAALQSDASLRADYPVVTAQCRIHTAARAKTPKRLLALSETR
ncbi:hypothetical protein [Novosphingobium kunmingense]|nr:hypothetical protein [Novosphingobium kunmingense]